MSEKVDEIVLIQSRGGVTLQINGVEFPYPLAGDLEYITKVFTFGSPDWAVLNVPIRLEAPYTIKEVAR